jgi:aspartyl-tRNA(Asn)/glutamyl-tRNA(Gln) amidotransferase subunit B
MADDLEVVIGLEVHCQLDLATKMFSACPLEFGAEPNSRTDPYTLGLPGTLPLPNAAAVRAAVALALATGCTIHPVSLFARKHYFYPDLPKGYQITQSDRPYATGGAIELPSSQGEPPRLVRLIRIHLEEDAGKNLHTARPEVSLLDYNRAGAPLLEIVSEPDLRAPEDAALYMRQLRTLVRTLGISRGNMEEGTLRCDANVSLRPRGSSTLGERCEIKNLNSFRFIEKAILHEVERQIDVLESGGKIVQETRLYDSDRDETRSMRSKEEANDYRYFPDPDLLPLEISPADIEKVRAALPELPDAKQRRFVAEYGLPEYDAGVLTGDKAVADYYEAVVRAVGGEPKLCANWVMGDLAAKLNEQNLAIEQGPVPATMLAGMLKRMQDGTISGRLAKEVFEAMFAGEGDADAVIERKGLKQITDTGAIERAIDEVMAKNPGQLAEYRAGKDKLFGFFVGQVMKATGGKANPAALNDLLKKKLQG